MDPSETLFIYFREGAVKNSSFVSLTNLAEHPLAFKIRSSHNLNYTVKPALYVLAPGEHLKVEVTLSSRFRREDPQYQGNRLQLLSREFHS